MSNVLGLLDPNHAKLAIILVRQDGRIHNIETKGWDPLPSGGKPQATHILRMLKPITDGPLRFNSFLPVDQVPTDLEGVFAAIFPLDEAGNLGDQIDLFPWWYLAYNYGIRGGFSRT